MFIIILNFLTACLHPTYPAALLHTTFFSASFLCCPAFFYARLSQYLHFLIYFTGKL